MKFGKQLAETIETHFPEDFDAPFVRYGRLKKLLRKGVAIPRLEVVAGLSRGPAAGSKAAAEAEGDDEGEGDEWCPSLSSLLASARQARKKELGFGAEELDSEVEDEDEAAMRERAAKEHAVNRSKVRFQEGSRRGVRFADDDELFDSTDEEDGSTDVSRGSRQEGPSLRVSAIKSPGRRESRRETLVGNLLGRPVGTRVDSRLLFCFCFVLFLVVGRG